MASEHSEFSEEDLQLSPEQTDIDALILAKQNSIKTHFKCQRVLDILNFRLFNQSKSLGKILLKVWDKKIGSQIKLQ